MTWAYRQSTGELTEDGQPIGAGYSGHGDGLNDPAMERDRGIGPIPAGKWHIGTAFKHPHLGPCVMHLSPVDHAAFGRSGFFIHGDNNHGDKSASHGCLILGPHLRHAIAESRNRDLIVTN